MCGIFGGISIRDPLATLNNMSQILAHRGPDDKGVYIKDNLALGHRRLSIIDLDTGHQPMFSQDKRQVLVYNGELYNYKEIREELIKKKHSFITKSDTEVIINAYREWGYSCLNKFNGMFAFVLWDEQIKKLWLVRDRIGKKPLYYIKLNNVFYFASESKALSRVSGVRLEYDFRAIDQYLTYLYVPGTRTFYKGITKLAAGHSMLVDRDANITELKRWWSIPEIREGSSLSPKKQIDDYCEEFHSIFISSVRSRLVSDVPLGLFLSSGIDSSSIALEMAKVSPPTLITLGFGTKKDEISLAGLLAKKINAKHYSFFMSEKDFDYFPQVVAAMDEPYGDPIILATFLLAKKASDIVKVVLTGDGADEVLGGYVHHDFFRKAPEHLPACSYRIAALLFRLMSPTVLNLFFNYPAALGRSGKERMLSLLNSYPNIVSSYLNFAGVFSQEDKHDLYSADFKAKLETEPDEIQSLMRERFNTRKVGALDKILEWDLGTWFPEQTLMKLDRLTMAHSVEGRCPYADHRLIELLFKMPFAIFKKISSNKQIIRDRYKSRLSHFPQRKQAFYLPLSDKYNSKIDDLKQEVFGRRSAVEQGWFNNNYIDSLFVKRGQSDMLLDKKVMSLIILKLWLNSNPNPN
ncbi:MAG: asparagine synthase (glutamine-hydrolyzing) [Candidatus Omnitrophica bacterium]|nr:asparagine synthase (glutamine-hydrolyzing) [Candidatus Omnitrophota bacterium]